MLDLFLDLLHISLGNKDCFSRIPSAKEWHALFEESKRQAISGVLLEGVERLPYEMRPPKDILLQWIGLVQVIEHTSLLPRTRAKELTDVFYSKGFDACILKGIGFALVYPNPLRRQNGDIDLWTSGNRRDVMDWLNSRYEIVELRWHHTDARIFRDVQTEIHFHSTWLFNPFNNYILQKWLSANGIQLSEKTKFGIKVPNNQFNVVYSLVHCFHHLLESGIGFRHVVDYYYLLQVLRVDNYSYLSECIKIIKQCGLYRFLGAMMFVLKEACGMPEEMMICKPNIKEGMFLLSEIVAAGNFGHQRKGKALRRNSVKRLFVMGSHYPFEVLWIFPWKVWHLCWRLVYNKMF